MTDPTTTPYTDEDLRAEAALCQSALSVSPTVGDILRWLPGAYVTGRGGDTWGDTLDNTGLAEAARKIHALIEQTGNAVGVLAAARWLIDLGADGLEADEHRIDIGIPGDYDARVLFAFNPRLDDAQRAEVVRIIASRMGT